MKNRPLTFKPELEDLMRGCVFCSLGMVDQDGKPYVIHMNFGYEDDHLYFHGAQKGKKIDILRKNPEVCVTFSKDHELRYVNEEVACSWAMRYRSVIAYGQAEFVEDPQEKIKALNIIMKNYTDREFSYNAPAVEDVCVFRVAIARLDGRAYGY